MKADLTSKPAVTPLDHILSSAVVLNWDAVACQVAPATVRLEYHIGSDGLVEYLKLWVRGREYWSLICDYTPNAGWSDGPRFANGYHSRSLGRLVQSILMNQGLFRHDCGPNTNATLEIHSPTAEDISLATERVNEAFPRPSKTPAFPLATRSAVRES